MKKTAVSMHKQRCGSFLGESHEEDKISSVT